MDKEKQFFGKIAVVVAHPDDETLWAGGTLLNLTFDNCFILSLCRATDYDRAPRFALALKKLGSTGAMADLDDGPDQIPLSVDVISTTIIEKLPHYRFDRIYTHSPYGEYTRHVRHEETGRALLKLWTEDRIKAEEICLFAYEDGGHRYLPRPIEQAQITCLLTEKIWQKKYKIISEIYNFPKESFEARTTPRVEAFWLINNKDDAIKWLEKRGKQ